MALCSNCANFDLQAFGRLPDRCLALSFTSVETNAQARCEFCTFLLGNAIEQLATTQPDRIDRRSCWIRLSLSGEYESTGRVSGCFGLHISVSDSKFSHSNETVSNPASFSHEYCIAAEKESQAFQNRIVAGRYLGQNRTSAEYAAAIKEWLEDCIDNHSPGCSTPAAGDQKADPHKSPLPARCIHIAKGGKGISLRDCTGMHGSYITLSHRWTEAADRCKTVKKNYEQRMRGADFDGLSQNFKDAFLLAERLGIFYVWIDSLCIVQDDPDDLTRELIKMAPYYRYSLFTIAAETAASRTTGFLHLPPERPISNIVRLPYREAGVKKGYFYIYKRNGQTNQQYREEVDQSDLLSRGWVCQEWFLSRRIIHFTPSETFLECQSRKPRSVCNHIVRQSPAQVHGGGGIGFQLGFKSEFTVDPSNVESMLGSWYDLVEAYSHMSLTFAGDHLKAIAGIASEFSMIVATAFPKLNNSASSQSSQGAYSDYISGLWLPDIHHGLLWRGVEDRELCPCGAPSWSWLAGTGPVKWPLRHDKVVKECEIISIKRDDSINSDAYLITMTRILSMRGKCKPIIVRGPITFKSYQSIASMTGNYIGHRNGQKPSTPIDEDGGEYYAIYPIASPQTTIGWGTFERPNFAQFARQEQGYLALALLVARRKNIGRSILPENISSSLWGRDVVDVLFLEPAEDGEGRFRRIGVGSVFEKETIAEFDLSEKVELNLV
ncbi:Fc.00g070690.m01.CDS01 [Cosmosporella sp. VM-42]